MAKKNTPAPAPLTFDLPVSLLAKIEAQRKKLGLGSISEVVRLAVDSYDPTSSESNAEEHRQVSVRISAQAKTALGKAARKQKVSVGELVRAAVEALPAKKTRK